MSSIILLLVSDIMTQDKKVKKNDIEKLRMILDNPSDPKVRKIVAKHEKNLESIRERLSDEPSKTKIKYTTSDFLKKPDSLEPRVVIHQKEEIKSIPSEIVSPETKSYKAEQQKEEYSDEDDFQDLFDDEDLYEVEKVDVSEPEFLQVKPKETEKIFEKAPKETEEALPIPIPEENKPTKEILEKDEKLPEWEPVEETKPEEIEKIVGEKPVDKKEEPTTKEFTEVTTIDEKIEPQKLLDETEEEIPTWEPIELEKTKEEKEMPSDLIEEKPADATFEEVSEKKAEEPATAVKESKAELKRKEKELKKKRKEEQKLKKLEEKKKKREAKQQENELKKRQKEEQKQIGELAADGEKEKEIVDRSEIKDQKIEEKKAKKEKEAQIKAQLKKDKILAASEKKELKKSKKRQKEEKKLKRAEPKTPELKADKELPIEEKIVKDTTTEWESYDIDEVPDKKPDTSVYIHGDFTLYKKEIKTATGKKRTVHFFSKKTPDMGDAVQLPEGYEVKVNRRTGLPYLKKK